MYIYRGVDVTLVYDSFGSAKLALEPALLNPLRAAGAKVVEFNPLLSGISLPLSLSLSLYLSICL